MVLSNNITFSKNHHDISLEINGNVVTRKNLPLLKKSINDKILKDEKLINEIYEVILSKQESMDLAMKEFTDKTNRIMEDIQIEIENLTKK